MKELYIQVSTLLEMSRVYGKQQTSDSSWEFLRIEKKQIKTVQNNSYTKNWHETTYMWVEVINSKRQIRGKFGYVVEINFCPLA